MPQECVCVGGEGGGYSDIFYIYVSWDHFWGFKILNFNIFFFFGGGGGGSEISFFLGYEDFVDISLQSWTGFRGHFYTFQVFFS